RVRRRADRDRERPGARHQARTRRRQEGRAGARRRGHAAAVGDEMKTIAIIALSLMAVPPSAVSSPQAATAPRPAAAAQTPQAGTPPKGDAASGKKLFVGYGCYQCHG